MHHKRPLTRRAFLGRAAVAAAAPWIIPGTALGKNGRIPPSERIIVATIGCGNRARADRAAVLAEPDTQIVAVCDVRGDRRRATVAEVNEHYKGEVCTGYIDMEEMLARPDIDAVVIAIGDRWHALAAARTMRAGKDVYCEKPCSFTIAQAQSLLATARSTGRIFQAGTQRRSEEPFIFVRELALGGYLGKLHSLQAHLWAGGPPENVVFPEQPLPTREELEWDMWLGPVAWRPYNPSFLQWHNKLDFWGGCVTEWGSHTVDLCQWGAGIENESGAEYEFAGDETGEGMTVKYPGGLKMWLSKDGDPKWPGSCGFKLEGTEGWANASDGNRVDVYPKSLFQLRRPLVQAYLARTGRVAHHMRDFLDGVRTRRPTITGAESMHKSHLTVHAAVIACTLKRSVKFDHLKEEFAGDEEANRLRVGYMRAPYTM